MLRILATVNVNADWKTLHDFYVVAAGVFRRKKAEERPGRTCHVFNCAAIVAAEAVDVDGDGLAGVHAAELCFLEVRGDPDIANRDDGEQCLAGLNAIAELRRFCVRSPRLQVHKRCV